MFPYNLCFRSSRQVYLMRLFSHYFQDLHLVAMLVTSKELGINVSNKFLHNTVSFPSYLTYTHQGESGLTEQSGFTSVLISIFTSLVSIFLINGTHIAILQFLLLEMKVAFKEAILVSREVRFYFHLCFNLSRQVYLMRYALFSGSSSGGYASGIQGISSQHQQQISPQYSKFSFLPHLHSSRQICDLTIRFYYSSYFSFYLLD